MGTARAPRVLCLVIIVSALAPVAPTVADVLPFCGDVQLVWARGTGEQPASPVFQNVDTNLNDRLGPGVSYSTYELGKLGGTAGREYPAQGEGFGFFFAWNDVDFGEYQDSKEEGEAELDVYLTQRAVQCPGEVYVLGGWNQGAQVVGEALFLLDRAVQD